ncbi:MAG: RluA family pseudouridine synthase [Gemmatimonadota bacterium]
MTPARRDRKTEEGGRAVVLEVAPDEAGERIDVWLAGRLSLSRTRIQKLVAAGQVRVDGEVPTKSDPTEGGASVEVTIPAPEPARAEPEDLPVDIVWEDADLLVVNKAAGMVVHPAPGHRTGTLVNALLHHVEDLSGIGGTLRPGIVHRLDKDTSGLLVVAKSDPAHRRLSDALRRRRVKRLYRAATWGHLEEEPLKIDAPIGRDPADRKRMAVVEDGRRAITRVRVRERWQAAELLDVALQTGRTHQIRVHLAHLGHPVVGDQTYGPGWERGLGGPHRRWARELARRTPRQFLHATGLAFDHPLTGERMRFRVSLPADLLSVAEWARGEP